MPSSSAGSRSTDDRRRRRLAQDAQEAPARRSSTTLRSHSGSASSGSSEQKPPLPDESLIPRSPWKISVLASLGFCLWGAMLWLGLAEWPRQHGLQQIGALFDGTFPKLLTTGALLLAVQLSYLILWYRSRARKDFQGRYRVWGWAGLFWGVTCLCVTTGLHIPTARMLYESYPLNCWRPELTYWLAPFAIGVLTLHRLLSCEMAHCRESSVCWRVTLFTGALVGGLELGGDLFLPAQHRVELVTAANTLWHGLVTLTFLIHARHVVHVTNEAAPRRASRDWMKLPGRLRSLIRRPTRSKPVRTRKAQASATKKKPSPVRKPVADAATDEAAGKKRVLGKNVRMDSATDPVVPAPHVPVARPAAPPVAAKPPQGNAVANAARPNVPPAKPVQQAKPVKSAPVNNVQMKASPAPAMRELDDEDNDDDEGSQQRLSKKERRKLKQQR